MLDKADGGAIRNLRCKAIEALGNIGTRKSIRRLQSKRQGWHPALERSLYIASEEIDWRMEYSPER